MEKGFKKWYNKYVGQKKTAGAVSRPLDEASLVEAFLFFTAPIGANSGI